VSVGLCYFFFQKRSRGKLPYTPTQMVELHPVIDDYIYEPPPPPPPPKEEEPEMEITREVRTTAWCLPAPPPLGALAFMPHAPRIRCRAQGTRVLTPWTPVLLPEKEGSAKRTSPPAEG